MEAWLAELRPYEGEPGTSSGWRLAKSSWKVIRTQRAVGEIAVGLAVLMAAYSTLGMLVHLELTVRSFHESLWPLRVIGQFLALFVLNFGLLAALAATDAALDGTPMAVADAIAEAREIAGPNASWSAASTAFFVALAAITHAWALGLAIFLVWYLASFFVLPALLIDRLGTGGALAESARLLRPRWRAVFGIALWMLVVLLFASILGGFFFTHAGALNQEGRPWRGLAAVGLAPTMAVISLGFTAQQIASLLVFRDSFEDLPGTPWAGPRRGRGAKFLRVCGGVVIFFVLCGALSAATKHDRKVLRESRAPGANYSIVLSEPGDLPSGSPVLYEGRRIGVVLGSSEEGGGLSVHIHVEPGYSPESTPGEFHIEAAGEEPSLVLEPAGGGPLAQPDIQQS